MNVIRNVMCALVLVTCGCSAESTVEVDDGSPLKIIPSSRGVYLGAYMIGEKTTEILESRNLRRRLAQKSRSPAEGCVSAAKATRFRWMHSASGDLTRKAMLP